jgi:mannose-6-phosphate isomerase-like protein (cupin superfamily)
MPNLSDTFAVLAPSLAVTPVPVTPTIYQELDERFGGFTGHVLIATHEFHESWPSWEIHPKGDELVVLLSGEAQMVLDEAAGKRVARLANPGDYVIVPRGTWHTARISMPTRMLFVTPGEGTQNRPA